ncbi:ribonuclease III [Pseudomarimonas arenosa]|uniref:Ribonuclease 3 n=1 Tax=Pseudomarimonas arenosa TaxID=2774145 RepID=A0AAW3ZJE3_9GAMM|nr:ribonuclease III [Pseudomarimonas arenosa]MBD8524812.1 ribonuclease III [Pseudomarimonas arenosa]
MSRIALGYRFQRPEVLEQALRHRSAGRRNNERLEFFGDALIGAVVSEALMQRYPNADEGVLTRLRSQLVRESSLAEVARALDLGPHLTLGPGELKSGGYRRESILADAVEALAAAIYLDGGFAAMRDEVIRWLQPNLETLSPKQVKDAKTRLQEWLQGRQHALPDYQVVAVAGEEHERIFTASCQVAALDIQAEGCGGSRRAAEQEAAAKVLQELGESE